MISTPSSISSLSFPNFCCCYPICASPLHLHWLRFTKIFGTFATVRFSKINKHKTTKQFSSQRASSPRGRGQSFGKEREKREDGRSWRERVTSFECPTNLLLYPDYYTTAKPTSYCTKASTEVPFSPPAKYQIPNLLLYSDHQTSTLPYFSSSTLPHSYLWLYVANTCTVCIVHCPKYQSHALPYCHNLISPPLGNPNTLSAVLIY